MKDKKNLLRLTTKIHNGHGIVSSILGFLSAVFFGLAVWTSAFEDRSIIAIQNKIGILETIAIALSLVGIVYGIIGETQKDRFKFFSHLGIVLNAIAIVLHIIVLVFSL
ncbi:MAG: hypothetical protein CVU84_05305 [Firmicutes bacterium HGW-Firmicutes-1]|jgi:hypothetical protein|nr:MAG: hypothetical protein CVU84_05305 [Firmicutes bacterium HGW-Firmicutes-1]